MCLRGPPHSARKTNPSPEAHILRDILSQWFYALKCTQSCVGMAAEKPASGAIAQATNHRPLEAAEDKRPVLTSIWIG